LQVFEIVEIFSENNVRRSPVPEEVNIQSTTHKKKDGKNPMSSKQDVIR
jgi:hypothetical protein